MINIEDRLPTKFMGFYYRKSNNALILNSDDYSGAATLMQSENITHLEINANFYLKNDLSFIDKFKFIEGLTVISQKIKDLSPIQYLVDLKILNIDYKAHGNLDFSSFEKLEECFFVWGLKGSESIYEATSLKKLRIDRYSNPEIPMVSNLIKLTALSLYHSNIINLLGISNLHKLKQLDLTGSKHLSDLELIVNLSQLEILRLDSCKSLASLQTLKTLSNLKSLSFNNVGSIDSVRCLDSLDSLEEIFFTDDTNILDGDLLGLLKLYTNGSLRNSIFKSRKHYSHKPKDLGFKVPDSVANIFNR